MEIWTDGTTIVQACDNTGAIRVFTSRACTAQAAPEHPLWWKTPLAVDAGAGRIWANDRVEEFRLDDLARVTTHTDRVLRLAALGDGRLAAVLPGGRDTKGVRLAVGTPGAWEREVVLNDLHDKHPVTAGLAMTDDEPTSRHLDGDPTLTATEHGIVVADGRRGVVAHFTPDLDLVGLWYAGGIDETELIGYATDQGILTTARWAGRDSLIFRLTPEGPRELLAEYAAFAMPADGDRTWVVGNFDILLLDRDGGTLATANTPSGLVLAACAAGRHCALGTASSVTLVVADGDTITTRTLPTEELVDIIGVFPDAPRDETALLKATSTHSLRHGHASHTASDGEHHIVVREVRVGGGDDVRAALRAAGATAVESRPHTADGPRHPCCEGAGR
ncbi:hypothetical protein LO772_33690 [Yinghuangia sp. ASG 101]|uniref:hypothetical protein n=1 Tax=Yinghuangia sp. ASG 101 TaxID=2896848 RepID=UPI001E553936|nr:hypothetical protein [Yinghuangia sp. ASG 101]UGQ11669.1 hypothetical protein LO772_33690 [Yinghuangia sp. ASG 101]